MREIKQKENAPNGTYSITNRDSRVSRIADFHSLSAPWSNADFPPLVITFYTNDYYFQ